MLASGEAIGPFLAEGNGRPAASNLKTSVSGGAVTGRKIPVADGGIANFAVVVAASDQVMGRACTWLNWTGWRKPRSGAYAGLHARSCSH